MKTIYHIKLLLLLLVLTIAGCTTQSSASTPQEKVMKANQSPQVEFILRTAIEGGSMAYIGVGGDIDGLINPKLSAKVGNTVRIVLSNGDGMPHDVAVPDLNAQSSLVAEKDRSAEVVFSVPQSGIFVYFCTVAGHRQAGMEGKLIVTEP